MVSVSHRNHFEHQVPKSTNAWLTILNELLKQVILLIVLCALDPLSGHTPDCTIGNKIYTTALPPLKEKETTLLAAHNVIEGRLAKIVVS